jgi:sugar phosphate isomerase/epimerase
MSNLKDMEIGLMFWAGGDPVATLREVKGFGVRCGQLGIPGDMPLEGAAAAWGSALRQESFRIVTVFAAYTGENYADIPTVARSVGFIPEATREERVERTLLISDFAAALGVGSIACHIGFVPHDPADPNYLAARDIVRKISDRAAGNNQTFALETGQEPAEVLLRFLEDVARENVRINFDPANLIMYGTGDPIEALGVLGSRVVSVHCKDGVWPPKGVPGALGSERPLGQGDVGMVRFVARLKEIGYRAPLNIEHEIEDRQQRAIDNRAAVELLTRLRDSAQ